MIKDTAPKVVIPASEMAEIERKSIRQAKGSLVPTAIRCFIEHISTHYGIDIGFETEEMKNEREAKAYRKQRSSRSKLGRKSSRDSADDF